MDGLITHYISHFWMKETYSNYRSGEQGAVLWISDM